MILLKKKEFIINFFYLAIWTGIIYFSFVFAAGYMIPFLIGVFVAYYVQKPAKYISKKFCIKKQKCAAILSILIFLGIIIFLSLLFWIVYEYSGKLVSKLFNSQNEFSIFLKNIDKNIEGFIKRSHLKNTIQKVFDEAALSFGSTIASYMTNLFATIVKNLPSILISCVFTIVSTCYISSDYDKLLKFFKGIISIETYSKIVIIKEIFTERLLKIITGYFLIFVINFIELTLGLFLLGVKSFFIISFLTAILDLLPIIGTGTILLPWAIFSFIQNNYKYGFGLILLYVIIVVVRNFLEPKIIGKQMELNPVFTLIFIFIGFKAFGIIGMFVLPLIITVLFTYYTRSIN